MTEREMYEKELQSEWPLTVTGRYNNLQQTCKNYRHWLKWSCLGNNIHKYKVPPKSSYIRTYSSTGQLQHLKLVAETRHA